MWRLVALLAVAFCASSAQAACSYPAKYPNENIMCLYPAAACGDGEACGLTEQGKIDVVRIHNEYRSRVAGGEETLGSPGPQPSANDIKELVWDDGLAKTAQRWAEQNKWKHDCGGTCKMPYGPCGAFCRDTPKFLQVGQNLGMDLPKGKPDIKEVDWKKVIASWYDEVKDQNANTNVYSYKTGHYTQVVWGETYAVGCGVYSNGKPCPAGYTYSCYVVVCNYGPAGNFPGDKVYGSKTCSKKSDKYPKLCASGP